MAPPGRSSPRPQPSRRVFSSQWLDKVSCSSATAWLRGRVLLKLERPLHAGRVVEWLHLDDPVHSPTVQRRRIQRPERCVVQVGHRLHRSREHGPRGKLLTLAESWNGTTWTIQSSPNPAGAGGSHPERCVVQLGHRVHRGRNLPGKLGCPCHAGRRMERLVVVRRTGAQPGFRPQRPQRRVVHLGQRLHRRGQRSQQLGNPSHHGAGMERHLVVGSAHTEPTELHREHPQCRGVHLGQRLHRRRRIRHDRAG